MKLVHASISENGNAGLDGKAKPGDQTGKEVFARSWFSYPWDFVLRYPDKNIAMKASVVALKLANSNLVGYNQSTRNTLFKALKANNFDVDRYIATGQKTETDCSAFVYACFACFIPSIRMDNNAPVTFTMKKLYKAWGFEVLTNSAYLVNGTNLIPGDIVVNENHHTAIISDGNTATTSTTPPATNATISDAVKNAIDVIARDVLRGKWGNGEERKQKIYNAIQSRINDLLKG